MAETVLACHADGLTSLAERTPAPSCLLMRICSFNQVRTFASSWQVSSCGRVRSSTGVVSCGSISDDGYRRVYIEGASYYVHRLVATAFLGQPLIAAQWQVNHIDRDRGNNCKENLKYVTPSDNMRHAWATREADRKQASYGKPVLWRESEHQSWSFAPSRADAARAVGVSTSCISRACSRLSRSFHVGPRIYELKNADAVDAGLLSNEAWQPAVHAGEEGVISDLWVSNCGRICSKTRCSTWLLFYGYRTIAGYYIAQKSDRSYKVHRLVAGTFLGQPASPGLQVNHKDLDRGNNHVRNLEYVTQSQNIRHAFSSAQQAGLPSKVRGSKPVEARLVGSDSPWIPFESIKAAAAHTGIRPALLSAACKGEQRGCNPLAWEFRFLVEEPLPGEEWRPVILEGARVPPSRA